MAASANDLFMEVGSPGTATTLSSPGYTSGVSTSITVGSTSNWPTNTGIIFAIDQATTDSDGNEVRVAGTYNEFEGTVASATSITNVDYVGGDAERSYSAGATTRVYVPVSAERENRLAQGLAVEHNKLDGTHDEALITSRTEDTAPASGDFLLTADVSASNALKKVTKSNLLAGAVGNAEVIAGMPVQMVTATSSALATGTTVLPLDDTVPQITEGDEYLTATITPKSATNILVATFTGYVGHSSANHEVIAAIFRDATANALSVNATFNTTANTADEITTTATAVAGSTSATTFRVRCGSGNAGTTTFNGGNGARRFGTCPKASLVITEYKA